MKLNILFIGDIIGKPGQEMVQMWLPGLEKKYNAVITGGNHTWDKHQSQDYLKAEPRSLRPLNYPKGTYGNGYHIAETNKGKVGVINLQGRSFMADIDCPFRTADWIVNKIRQETKVIFIDFHAEATAEKIALFSYLDGKISALVGTHTHVQTADERISEKGTAFITDAGMTGPYDSVIGMKTEAAINRFLYSTPQKYQTASENRHLCGVFIQVDSENGSALEIERIIIPEFDKRR